MHVSLGRYDGKFGDVPNDGPEQVPASRVECPSYISANAVGTETRPWMNGVPCALDTTIFVRIHILEGAKRGPFKVTFVFPSGYRYIATESAP